MAFGQPQQPVKQQQQGQAMGRVGQAAGSVLGGMNTMPGPMMRRGPNQSRMDPNNQMMGAMGGGPVGMPPPPNPGLGPSQPAVQNLAQGAASMFGGGPPPDMPRSPMPPMQVGNDGTDQSEIGQANTIQNYMANMNQNPQNDPMQDRRNALIGMKSLYGQVGQGGQFGMGMQKPDVMPRGPMNSGPMIGNGMAANFGNQLMKPGNPMMARGGMGIGPSFMGNAQPIQQAPPNQPAPMTQSRRFGGGMGMNQ